jgi:hypothetical protein
MRHRRVEKRGRRRLEGGEDESREDEREEKMRGQRR